jgi:hypothetical protein
MEGARVSLKESFLWTPLDAKWRKKLMSDKFVEKDCIGDGNCQFRSIETALTNAGYKTNHKHLRNVIAKYIRNMSMEDFANIIQMYIIEKQSGEFVGGWDPTKIRNKLDFIKEIKKPGFNFEGDNVTLALLSKATKIDFIIFDDNYNITNLSNDETPNEKIVILMYSGNTHYKTIGLQTTQKTVKTLFKREQLPPEIDNILDRQGFLMKHIRCIMMSLQRKRLNDIINILETILQTKLSAKDKRTVMKIVHILIQNENAFA